MKKLTALLLVSLLACTSCTALPAEERAFAVALLVEKDGAIWRVHGRIPTYQTGGGYLTVTGEGETLAAALSAMDAAAPMVLHLSQLRLVALDAGLGASGDLAAAFAVLSQRPDVRQDCAVAITNTPAKELMDALKPATGARLSKAIDVLLESRIAQGVILPATLADVARMGERQSPVLISLTLEDGAVSLSGGWPTSADMTLVDVLSPAETALLSMMLGHGKSLRLTLDGGSAEVRDVSAQVRLSEDFTTASVEITLRATASALTPDALEQALADECLALLSRLSAGGCDVLGLGRQAVWHTHDMAEWHTLDWPARLMEIRWSVAVGVRGPA